MKIDKSKEFCTKIGKDIDLDISVVEAVISSIYKCIKHNITSVDIDTYKGISIHKFGKFGMSDARLKHLREHGVFDHKKLNKANDES